jgi:hypothetical protein
VLDDIDSNEQRTATPRPGLMRMLACYEEILKRGSGLSRQTSVLDFLKSSSGTHALTLALLGIGDGDTGDTFSVQEEVRPL